MMTRRARPRNPSTVGWTHGRWQASLSAMPTTLTPAVVAADALERIEARGTTVVIRAAGPALTVTDHTIPPGFPGPPLHVHPGFDEVFLVLEGTLAMRVADDAVDVDAGGTASVPGAVAHTFANATEAPVRFLCVMTPGGFEAYFRALAAGDDAAMAGIAARVGYRPA